jgi:hypothetical protein
VDAREPKWKYLLFIGSPWRTDKNSLKLEKLLDDDDNIVYVTVLE